MKYFFICLMGMMVMGSVCADTFFSLEKIPPVLEAVIRPNQDIDLKLEENCSTGYTWVASYDARVCSVSIEHKRPEYAAQDGSGGYAKIEIEPIAAKLFSVTLNYIDPNVTNAVPSKTMKVNVTVSNTRVLSVAPVPSSAATAPKTVVSGQPANIPVLIDDQSFRFDTVPAALQVILWTGRDIDFELEEKPEENLYWRVGKYDASVCRVELEHERGGVLKRAKAEIEIEAVAPGTTVVEFIAGSGVNEKVLRCFVTVK